MELRRASARRSGAERIWPSRWPAIARVTTGLGQYLTDAARAVARENPRLQGVVDTVDFNATAAGVEELVQLTDRLLQVLRRSEA